MRPLESVSVEHAPLRCEDQYALQHHDAVRKRFRDTEELEVLAGFEEEFTLPLWKTSRRKAEPARFQNARERAISGALDPQVVGVFLGELMLARGYLAEPVSLEEIAWRRVSLKPAAKASLLVRAEASSSCQPTARPHVHDLVRWLLCQQSARGGEVRNFKQAPHAKGRWQEFDAGWVRWTTALSVPWRWRENINVAEARGRDLAVRLRARSAAQQQLRFVHLLDSQVNLSSVAKGRSGSARIRVVHRRSAGTLLATGLREVVSYVRSQRNPADKASRNKRLWAKARRALGIKRKAVLSQSRRATREAALPPA